jgi:hypothetical protein
MQIKGSETCLKSTGVRSVGARVPSQQLMTTNGVRSVGARVPSQQLMTTKFQPDRSIINTYDLLPNLPSYPQPLT